MVGHYAAGARLIGLTENQLRRRMERLKARHAAGDNKSPYAEPLYIVFGKVGDVLTFNNRAFSVAYSFMLSGNWYYHSIYLFLRFHWPRAHHVT